MAAMCTEHGVERQMENIVYYTGQQNLTSFLSQKTSVGELSGTFLC
jgi:hypothetical protein